jgi:hypothetical protein
MFIQLGGLKIIFAVMMGKGKPSKAFTFSREQEEGICFDCLGVLSFTELVYSCIFYLFLSSADVNLERILAKFQENNFEKIQRMFETFEFYRDKVWSLISLS